MKISEQLIEMANEIAKDELKLEKGNFSAGTRIRQALIAVKKTCDEGRKKIQETRATAA